MPLDTRTKGDEDESIGSVTILLSKPLSSGLSKAL